MGGTPTDSRRGAQSYWLKVKRDKCQFSQESVKFLGHIVSARRTEPDPSKVEAVRNFAIPSFLTDVRAFIGIASYYRRFIKNFADIAAPLHNLAKCGKQEFSWTPSADRAFKELKSHLCSAPILSLPDFSLPFTVYTDSSDIGLGAVLTQQRGEHEHVIAYASRTLTAAEINYSTTEKECLAIVWSVNHWRSYLLGKAFDIVTDHQSLTWLQGLKKPNISLVMRRLGRPEAPTGNEAEDRENAERLRYRQLQTQLEMVNGILHRRVDKGTPSERLVLVVPRMMRADLLKLSHGDPSSGHMGINHCLERLQKRYYWPGMAETILLAGDDRM